MALGWMDLLVLGGTQLLSGYLQSEAAQEAGGLQSAAALAGIEEQRRQFEKIQETLKPYREAGIVAIGGLAPYAEAGAPALEQQQAIMGLLGPERQQAAIRGISEGAGFQEAVRQGEEALLSKASATGGLRGGNIQAALAQFRPELLQRAIEQQYTRLGGMTDMGRQTLQNLLQQGQSAAAGTGTAALQTGSTVSNLLQQQGAAQAGSALAQGRAYSGLLNLPSQLAGINIGAGGTGSLFD
jgi:hypothetical protein